MQPQTPIIGTGAPEPITPTPATGAPTPVTPTPMAGAPQPLAQAAVSQPISFTSNPFLAFGKGLGAGLYKSAGAVMGLSALLFLAVFGLYIGGIIVAAIGFIISPIIGILAVLVAFVLFYLVLSLLMGRGALALIKSQRGESITTKETGEQLPFKNSLQLAGYYVLYGIAVALGLIFFIVPGLIIMARWSLGLFVIADEKVGPIDAIKKSWELTKGNTWNMLGAYITSNVILGQAFLLTMGTLGATANRYHELKALNAAGIKNTTTHWLNYVMTILPILFVVAYFAYFAVVALSAYSNIENAAEQSSTTQTEYYDTQQDLQNSVQEYCFYNGEYSDVNAEYTCVQTKDECKANQYCMTYYGSLLEE